MHEAFCYIIIWLLKAPISYFFLQIKQPDSYIAISYILYPENSDKYTDILHQRDIWHGGKIIGKKVITVSTCMSLIINII